MDQQFSRVFRRVAIAHVIVLALFMGRSVIARLLEPKQEIVVPVEFMVDVRPPMPDNISESLPDIPDPEPEPDFTPDIPDPSAIPDPVPPPPKKKKKRKRPKIEISHTRVTRRIGQKPKSANRLSQAEIQKLLDDGAVAGDHTSIPDEDPRCMAVIKNTLYSLWDQPAKEDVGSAVAVMKLQLGGGGRVTRAVLSRRSGNAALDDSVERAASDIRRIRGLTPGFIRRHPSVTISFSVD